jgi:hypothetical protein
MECRSVIECRFPATPTLLREFSPAIQPKEYTALLDNNQPDEFICKLRYESNI